MNYYKENLTKVSFKCYDKVATWETPFNDADIQEIIQGFIGCMCSVCWDYDVVLAALEEYIYDHKNIEEEKENVT